MYTHQQLTDGTVKSNKLSIGTAQRQDASPCCYGNVNILVLKRHVRLCSQTQQTAKVKIFELGTALPFAVAGDGSFCRAPPSFTVVLSSTNMESMPSAVYRTPCELNVTNS